MFDDESLMQHNILVALKKHWDHTCKTSSELEDLKVSFLVLRRDWLKERYPTRVLSKQLKIMTQLKMVKSEMPRSNAKWVRFRLLPKGESLYLTRDLLEKSRERRSHILRNIFWFTGTGGALIASVYYISKCN